LVWPGRRGSLTAVVRRQEIGGDDMDKELQELVDRRAIDDLLIRYTTALDTRQLDLLDQVFTADAQIDYAASGGITGDSTISSVGSAKRRSSPSRPGSIS
jgi:hypothetical protein